MALRVRRWWRRPAASGDDEPAAPVRHLVDAHTRTFWSRGAAAPATLVEADTAAAVPRRARVTALLERHERAQTTSPPGRPRANPAFSEAVFVELMRARRYGRAFDLLSPDCQAAWGHADAFADAQRGGALRHLSGARVIDVRFPESWTDPDAGRVHSHVAELDVEYVLDNGRRRAEVVRTVHLVGVGGQWRSLCYPEPAAVAPV